MLKEVAAMDVFCVMLFIGLNPYFNGTCSKSCPICHFDGALAYGLNPYFNGTCSKSTAMVWKQAEQAKS